ncbi:MAG: extracellular solute-binding protein, partial [Tepidiformaceae bacterium]
IVPTTGSPVTTFAYLAKPGVKLVLASAAVPIGNYARQIFMKASGAGGISPDFSSNVLANLKSNETDVKAVLAKIQIGEGDAGVVYTTDAATVPGKVNAIAIPDQYNVIAQYPIAVLKASGHLDVAEAFQAFILSDPGQTILAKYGFGKPSATSTG